MIAPSQAPISLGTRREDPRALNRRLTLRSYPPDRERRRVLVASRSPRSSSAAAAPLSGRPGCFASPRARTAGTSGRRRTLGGIGIFAGLVAGVGARARGRRVRADERAARHPRRLRAPVRRRLARRRLRSCRRSRSSAAQVGRGRARARDRALRVEIVDNDWLALAIAIVWLVGMTNAFNLLDNMDGLAATLAAIASRVLRDRRGDVHPNDLVLASRSLVRRARLRRLPAVQPAPEPAARSSSWATPAARCSASRSPRSGSRRAGSVAGTTVATLLLPILVLAVPILDTALVTVARLLEGRPIYQGGRDHTSHRLVYLGLSERRAVVLLALICDRARRARASRYNVLDERRAHAGRRRWSRSRCSCSSRASSPTSSAADCRRAAAAALRAGVRRPLAAPGRGARRLRADHRRRSSAAYALAVRLGTDTVEPAYICRAGAAGRARRALPRLHPVRPLPRRLALRGRARRGRDRRARCVVSELVALGFLALTRTRGDFPRVVLRRRRADLHGR